MDPIGRLLSVGLILASLMTAPAPRPAWAAPGRLSHALAPDSRILRFVIGPDDHTVVYSVSIAGQPTEIWRTSIRRLLRLSWPKPLSTTPIATHVGRASD